MSGREQHAMTGRLTLVVRDDQRREIDRREVKNLITNGGRNLVAELFSGKLQAAPALFIAVGDSDEAAAVTDVALKHEVARAEAHAGVGDAKTNVVTVVATLPAVGSGSVLSLKEAGIVIQLGQSHAPVLYNRVTFPVVSKSPTMDITLSWEVVF
jgi:hypothetical protein